MNEYTSKYKHGSISTEEGEGYFRQKVLLKNYCAGKKEYGVFRKKNNQNTHNNYKSLLHEELKLEKLVFVLLVNTRTNKLRQGLIFFF